MARDLAARMHFDTEVFVGVDSLAAGALLLRHTRWFSGPADCASIHDLVDGENHKNIRSTLPPTPSLTSGLDLAGAGNI